MKVMTEIDEGFTEITERGGVRVYILQFKLDGTEVDTDIEEVKA